MACMWPQFSYWIEAPIKDCMPIQAKNKCIRIYVFEIQQKKFKLFFI